MKYSENFDNKSIIRGAKPAGAVKSVPKVTNVPRVPAHKATKTLSDMRNVVSTQAASNWSKKVYEPFQKASRKRWRKWKSRVVGLMLRG